MSVTISISDPASTPAEELQAVITMLHGFLPSPTLRVMVEENWVGAQETASQGAQEAVGAEEKTPVADIAAPASVGVAPIAASVFGYHATVPENRVDTVFPPAQATTVSMGGTQVVPAPPPAVEAPAFALTPPTPPAVELDKEGIPWDGRIHASTKTKTVEQVWKKKRGVEQAEVDRVVAELRTTMMAPAPAPVTEASVPPPPPAPAPVTEAAVPPAPPAPPAPTGITFAEFMGHVTGGVTSGRFTREAVAEACAKHGAVNLPGLINRTDLIPAVARELGLMA